ncbi:uncharacterized protein LOC111431307 isoform X2 [Cucurbita moschata]|uniref:Uncharacterized protein LOC111431307 isoform X2 n=1 Tax=Cucurbita moschata TaxID=3662 RepID=A0A6J1E6R4_CUCMO|nr:uncharacterized protein LOC111431307 isoform X2 [Cucurbita moschata]
MSDHIKVFVFHSISWFLSLSKERLRALRAAQELLNASDDAATEDPKKLVAANNFVTISITFCAGAIPKHGHTVALLNSDGVNHTVFYKCVFLGYQDTLYNLAEFESLTRHMA